MGDLFSIQLYSVGDLFSIQLVNKILQVSKEVFPVERFACWVKISAEDFFFLFFLDNRM